MGQIAVRALDAGRKTTRARARGKLRRSLFSHTPDIVTLVDAEGTVHEISPSVERLLGYDAVELIGSNTFATLHPDDQPRVARFFADLVPVPGAVRSIQFRSRSRAGRWLHFEASFSNLMHEPDVRGIVVSAHDISKHKRQEAHLRRAALRDPLTGLPNRTEFMNRLEDALVCPHDDQSGVAVLFVDLDRFKTINDTFGHAAGDSLLVQVSQRIATSLRVGDLLSRYGGDEFIILVERLNDVRVARHVAERVIDALHLPFILNGREVIVSASIGISVGLHSPVKARDLLHQADVALYQAKRQGRASYIQYEAELDAEAMQSLQLESELWNALEREEFRLLFQPEVELETGRIVGFEALARWQHPERGLLPPDAFIPFAEQTGLINPIGSWVLLAACRQAVAWQQPGHEPLTVSVNLAANQLYQTDFVAEVEGVLHETGLDPRCLKLEITEGVLIRDTEVVSQVLQDLKALGVACVLDDFGTGYSSLSYLTRFPVQTLKIDRTFVDRLGSDRGATAIVSAIATLAHGLNMETTVEGIETAEQLAFVRELHCARGQGFYFWAPLSAEAATELLKQHR